MTKIQIQVENTVLRIENESLREALERMTKLELAVNNHFHRVIAVQARRS